MVRSLFNLALGAVPVPHPAIDRLNLTWNDLRICFAMRKMNTQLFTQYFGRIRYWNWPWISEHMALDASFIYKYCRHIDWAHISRHQRLTVELVTQFETEVSWVDLSANPHLTIDVITRFATRLDWGLVCKTIVLDEDQIEQFLPYIDWYEVSLKSPMREPFIEKYATRVHWPRITAHQVLSDDFIDKHTARVDWDYISRHRPMDLTYIQQHEQDVDWGLISEKQKLGEPFILTNLERLDWEEIAYGQPISEAFFEKHAPKTPAVWAAFTAGRRLSPDFIARNIRSLPARELTRFQTFTLAEIDAYAMHLDWPQLSIIHTFTQPDQREVDVEFLRRHVDRIDWPNLVRTHVLPVDVLLEFRARFTDHDIRQTIPLTTLTLHPELVNRRWISQNCPLTVEYLTLAARLVDWAEIMMRHLPEDVVRTFPGELNIASIPAYQSSMSPTWIAEQARTARQWAPVEDTDPRYWPLYTSPANISHMTCPQDEFFRQNRDLFLAVHEFGKYTNTHVLLTTMASVLPICNPELADRIRFKIALNEINVPSSWDYLEGVSEFRIDEIVRTYRLSEAFLDRFQDVVDWGLVSKYQKRPFSEQFIRRFHDNLRFSYLQLPYDVTSAYLRRFGIHHDWAQLTPNLQEWQMKLYREYCNFRVVPQKTLLESFIANHFTFDYVATSQPLSEAFITHHISFTDYALLKQNTKLTLSQKFIRHTRRTMPITNWPRISNQTLSMPPVVTKFPSSYITQTELSTYSRYKLSHQNNLLDIHGPPNITQYNTPKFWDKVTLTDATMRRFIQTVNWREIAVYQQLSLDFLEEFKDKLCWLHVSKWQRLSEETIRKYKDYVIWPVICRHQKLTEDFIAEFADRVNWELVSPFSACF